MDIDSVSFGAKYINSVKIKKYDKAKKCFVDIPASFVQLEHCRSDIRAVDKIAQMWKEAEYIKKIATASHWMKNANIDIYALTTQTKRFQKLKPTKILGVAEMRKDDNRENFNSLYRFQVKPEAINTHNSTKVSHKYVGTAMLKSLKKIYKNISLFSVKSSNVENFYKKNGFIEDYQGDNHYSWSSNLFTKLKIYIEKWRLSTGV